MSKELPATLSSVRTGFATFFERVMVLYNLTFLKEEKDHKVQNVRKYSEELWDAGHISEYIKSEIDDAIDKEYKPGLYQQVDCFLKGDTKDFVTLEKQCEFLPVYEAMLDGVH